MSDAYSSLYSTRKKHLQIDNHVIMNKVDNEIDKLRSQSPKPVSSVSLPGTPRSIIEAPDDRGKAVRMKEFEDIKSKVTSLSKSLDDFVTKISSDIKVGQDSLITKIASDIKVSQDSLVDILNAKIDEQKKSFESVKTEGLKNAITEAVKQNNENVKSIAAQMVSFVDNHNKLRSEVEELKDIVF